ncbi:MAG: hypothetical protein WA908_04430, partial [Pontixanthobacter sp.]
MIDMDRRVRAFERPNLRIFMVWLLLIVIYCAVGYADLARGALPDPDSTLRLIQIRDLLNGQDWFDRHQYRIVPGSGGVSIHLSRLADLPLVAIIGVFTPIIGQNAAEVLAMVAVPMMLLGGVLFFVGRLAWRLFGVEGMILTCLIAGVLLPLVSQFQPMRIDHYGWLALAVAAALWAIAHRSPQMGGGIAGVAMGAGLIVSIDLLPISAAFGCVLALRWFA